MASTTRGKKKKEEDGDQSGASTADNETMIRLLTTINDSLTTLTTSVREEGANTRTALQDASSQTRRFLEEQSDATFIQVQELVTDVRATLVNNDFKDEVKDEIKDEVKIEGDSEDQTNSTHTNSTMSRSRSALAQGKRPLATTSIDSTKFVKALALVQPVTNDQITSISNLWDSIGTALSSTTSTPQSLLAYKDLSILLDFHHELLPPPTHQLYSAALATFHSLSQVL
jgi:Flp pilus assembly pilin Flp